MMRTQSDARQTPESSIIFGYPEEWKKFQQRNRLFFERFEHLKNALDIAFTRAIHLSEPIDRFVFFYGRLCLEDFFETVLCCGNGYGAGAYKLLRSLYERAVTLRYLKEHPDELQNFWDFGRVAEYKLTESVKRTIRKDAIKEEMDQKITEDFNRVKEKFMIPLCKACGTQKLNHTWSRLDFASMASKTGDLGRLIVPCYYIPLRHSHATVGSLLSRLEASEEEGIGFVPDAQRELADSALMYAHGVILRVLNVQRDHFDPPGLNVQIEVCDQDFIEVYGKKYKK